MPLPPWLPVPWRSRTSSRRGCAKRKAIYRPSAQPATELPAIDWSVCTRCGECVVASGGTGIDLMGVPSEEVIEVGAVIVATGYDHYRAGRG